MRYRILGSCVTRDAFEFTTDPDVKLEKYFARSSVASALSEVPFEGIDISSIPSAFQRRIVEWDLQKEFVATLSDSGFDRIVIDLIDERFDLLRNSAGALATRSNELLRATGVSDEFERIKSGSPEFVELWEAGWRRFISLVDAGSRRHSVIVHRSRWAERTQSGQQFRGHTAESIARANAFLDELHAIMERDSASEQFVAVPPVRVVGADDHKWGSSPFHYTDEYYIDFLRMLPRTRGAES